MSNEPEQNNEPTAPAKPQLQLIPDEPLNGEPCRVALSSIPEAETKGSRVPSASMLESVARFGVLTPVLLAPFKDGDPNPAYRLLAGRRRVMAARAAKHDAINAVVFPAGTTPREAVTLLENEQRSDNPLVELETIERILKAGGTLEEVCDAVGIDRRRLDARMRLANLIPELRDLLRTDKMAVGVAEAASRLTPEQQKTLYADAQASGGKVKGKDVAEAKRVRAAAAASALPGSMLDGSGDPEDGEGDAGGVVGPGGLTVALGGSPAVPNHYTPGGGFVVETEADARAAASALLLFLNPENDPFYDPGDATRERLENALRAFLATPEGDEADPTGGDLSPALLEALSGPGDTFPADMAEAAPEAAVLPADAPQTGPADTTPEPVAEAVAEVPAAPEKPKRTRRKKTDAAPAETPTDAPAEAVAEVTPAPVPAAPPLPGEAAQTGGTLSDGTVIVPTAAPVPAPVPAAPALPAAAPVAEAPAPPRELTPDERERQFLASRVLPTAPPAAPPLPTPNPLVDAARAELSEDANPANAWRNGAEANGTGGDTDDDLTDPFAE